MATSAPPTHLIVGDRRHGVAEYATDLADAVDRASRGTEILHVDSAQEAPRALGAGRRRLHIHVTDALFGAGLDEAARAVGRLTREHDVALTLHDLPQESDGPVNVVRRTKAYAAFAEDAVGISVSSHHEAALFLQHRIGSTSPKVIPLGARSVHASPGISSAAGSTGVEILMAGYVYPGKGHDEVLAAAAVLAGRDLGPIRLTVLGGAAPGHEAEARRLAARAGDTGVHFTVTGYLDRPSYESALAAPGVPVVAHLHYSASRSLLDWAEAGRKALVVGMRYTEEMAVLRPGTLVLTESDPLSLADSIERLAGDRRATRLGPGVLLAPSLDDVAAVYLSWWANLPW